MNIVLIKRGIKNTLAFDWPITYGQEERSQGMGEVVRKGKRKQQRAKSKKRRGKEENEKGIAERAKG